MITLLSLVALGFVLGMRHATDADHVVAVTTIVSRERSVRKAALVGVFWGIGHSFTVVVVGGAIVVFGLVVPERLGLSLEFTVALMLIGLGAWNLKSFFCAAGFWSESNEPVGDRRYFRETTAHDRASYHGHHRHESPPATPGYTPLQRMVRPLCIGVVHGLAGSAAVALMVLPHGCGRHPGALGGSRLTFQLNVPRHPR